MNDDDHDAELAPAEVHEALPARLLTQAELQLILEAPGPGSGRSSRWRSALAFLDDALGRTTKEAE